MKKHFLLLINLLFLLNQLAAQCPDGAVILLTQNDIDDFTASYPNCNALQSNLIIGNYPEGEPSVKKLDGLKNITAIEGYLYIQETKDLANLKGLENIVTISGDNLLISNNKKLTNLDGIVNSFIGGHIEIKRNEELININGLSKTSSVNGNLNISDNFQLNNIEGLQNITLVDSNLLIYRCGNLSNLNGLQNLNSIGGDLIIEDNFILNNLDGLQNLKSIGKTLSIENNRILDNLEALQNITTLEGGALHIVKNYTIKSLNGLHNITTIGGDLNIVRNDSLKSIEALQNISNFKGQKITIETNRNLKICSVPVVCNFITNQNAEFSIVYNAPGCNNSEEILEKCIVNITDFNFPSFTVFPNPTSGIFNIAFNKTLLSKASFCLYDTYGKQVIIPKPLTFLIQQSNYVDFSFLSNGVYYINIHLEDKLLQKKLLLLK